MSLQGIASGVTTQGVFTPENLIAGEFPRIQRIQTISGGQVLPQGAVLGRISATGMYVLSIAEATDGSEMPVAVLAQPVDASSADVEGHVFLTGEFNAHALTLGSGHTLASVTESFRTRSLFIRTIQP
jgi:hypothetical protein